MFKDYSFVFDIDGTICPVKKKDENVVKSMQNHYVLKNQCVYLYLKVLLKNVNHHPSLQ